MPNLSLKQKIMIAVGLIGAALILIFQRGFYNPPAQSLNTQTKSEANNSSPQVVATSPNPLDQAIILPNQTLEITFNLPLENRGEFKDTLEPKADYEVKLSDDRKTAKIIPIQPFQLGTSYTLFIKPDTKFSLIPTGKKTLDQELIFHFKTIEYRGV